jgi:peptidoglycan/xylan/chitin deacetylase (PgdA/CDA1 family)
VFVSRRLVPILCILLAALAVVALTACSSGSGTATSTTTPEATLTASTTASPPAASTTPTLEPTAGPVTPTLPPTATEPSPSADTPTPEPGPATVIYRGNPSRRAVALTFDAGAGAGNTAVILETLRTEGIRASFGVTGKWAEANRDLLNSIAADGHQIINHTYDHASFTGLSTGNPPLTPEERALELSRTEVSVYHFTQRSTRPYFRPPYGDIDDSVLRDAAADGYNRVIMWTVDTLGWNGATGDAIVERCLAQAVPGAIYVMHVGSESQDAAALPRVIAGLRAAGYTFETVDEIVRD